MHMKKTLRVIRSLMMAVVTIILLVGVIGNARTFKREIDQVILLYHYQQASHAQKMVNYHKVYVLIMMVIVLHYREVGVKRIK